MKPRVSLHTLGCKLNYAETSTLGRQFVERGFDVVEFGQPADVCVINTCTVTERADRECRQIIRRALRTSPDPFIIVTGCYAQLEPEQVASIDGVDLVLGSKEKFDLFRYAGDFTSTSYPCLFVSSVDELDDFGPAFSSTVGDRTRAFLKVQDGCDYSCSFCTIPLARGSSRSQGIESSVSQARSLVAQGFREVVLTGVNLGDFGRKSQTDLLTLLRSLVAIEGLERLRLSSIEPNLLNDDILEYVASTPKMCRHFHIPLQSGSDAVLRMMRRRYVSAQYAGLIHRVKERMPECGIGVDVIVGFPGETDDHFDETYLFLNELPVSYLHVFTYSERPHTPASGYAGLVDPGVRSRRNRMLRILSAKKKRAFYEEMVGRSADVLFESAVEDGLRSGLTDTYIRVAADARVVAENEIASVRIESVREDLCLATPMKEEIAA